MRSFILIFSLLVINYSCADENAPDMEITCEDSLTDLGTSAANWATSPSNHTQANCTEFKSHLLQVLNNCDTEIYWDLYGGESGWQNFVSEIEELDCSLFP